MVPPSSQWRVLFAVKPSCGMPLCQVRRFRTMVLLMQASVYKLLVRRSACAASEPWNRTQSQHGKTDAGAASLPAATWMTVFLWMCDCHQRQLGAGCRMAQQNQRWTEFPLLVWTRHASYTAQAHPSTLARGAGISKRSKATRRAAAPVGRRTGKKC